MGSHAPMRACAPEARHPRLAYSELYRHWFISNLTCPASPDVTFAAMIHCVRADRLREAPASLQPDVHGPERFGIRGFKVTAWSVHQTNILPETA
jgi:hypothetical protein